MEPFSPDSTSLSKNPFSIVNEWFSGVSLDPPNYEIVDCDAFYEVTFFYISPKNLLGDFFYSLNTAAHLPGKEIL